MSRQQKLNLSKKGIRCLGVAESFNPDWYPRSVYAGIVMRKDLIIDGAAFTTATLGGNDATDAVLNLFRALNRTDISLIMVSGAIVSWYNIIDPDRLHSETGLPVLVLTYRSTRGIERSIRNRFGQEAREKLEAYRRLGPREKILLKTGKHVYVRRAGISVRDAAAALNQFTLQGRYPEPIRVARLISHAMLEHLRFSLRQQQPGKL